LVELTIDGKKILTQPGATILETALANNIDIPRLCYHPELSISGGCRLCIVNVEGIPNPTPSCGLTCEDGMVIETQNAELSQIRREIIDLFISEHPLDCVTCDKSGACQLQNYAYDFGISATSHEFEISKPLYQDDNPFFIRDHQYCILCGRCVRVCDEVVGAQAIDFAGRGFECHIATPFDDAMKDSTCVFCGNCVQVCPTAALMPVSRNAKGREWELDRIKTICGYCGVGCQIEYALKDGEIIYAQSKPDSPVNGEFLCTKGRYGYESWEMPEKSPLMIRKPKVTDSFVPIDWDTALDLVAGSLAKTAKAYGSDSIMGLASARCTNEDNYIFQKFIRLGIGTNNLDHCARL
jgi:formate dehydrogenase alpha subunit